MPSSDVFDPTNYTALLDSGTIHWHSGNGSITYSFPTFIPAHYDVGNGYNISGYSFNYGTNISLTATQRAHADLAIARFNEVANLNLTPTAGLGDVTFGAIHTGDPFLYGFVPTLPNGSLFSGDIWLNNDLGIVATPTFYDEGWDTFIHELGHALGLDHSFSGTVLPAPLENSLYTVMSYDPIPSQAGIPDPQQQFPATPMLYDIQALQVQYGANMNTRAGNDTYFAANGVAGFEIADGGQFIATIWDAGGIDTFDASAQTSSVKIDLRPGMVSSIGGISDNILIALGVPGTTALSADIENATGGSASDMLMGNTLNNVLDGRGGADFMEGFGGDDTYIVDNAADLAFEQVNDGIDTVRASISRTLSVNLENLELTGNGSIDGTGNSVANRLTGNSGANRLDGREGADDMFGNGGNDTYIVDNVGDTVVEAHLGGGLDTIETTVSFDMSAFIDNLTMNGTNDIGTNGNDLANVINGNSGNNYINGGGGTDVMRGDSGNDTYTIDDLNDVIEEMANDGDDVVYASISAALSGNVETLILTSDAGQNAQGFGDDTNNQIFGNDFDNVIFGRGGTDYMEGRGGNDIFVFTPENGVFDVVGDFTDGEDRIGLSGFGTFEEGARLFQVSQTSYRADSADGQIQQVIVLQNYTGAALDHLDDYYFT